uniref:Uncharacterized protein n=1 Tax=Brassica campestris TaxID=3711 RepID=A0A3P6AR19_BRACM|nr:unnamed protein product [Brassica rapa]
MERDYLALDKRHPRLFVPSEFSKVVVNWPKQKLSLSMHTAVRRVFARPAENEEKGSEIIVGAQTGESSEQTPSKTIVKKRIAIKVAKKMVAEVDKSMDSDSKVDGDDDDDEKKVVEVGKKTPDSGSNEMKSPEEKKEEEPPRPGFLLHLKGGQ